jgi:hypothetical protein
MLLMEHHQRESRQVIGINTSESTAIVRRNNFNTMLLKLIFERRLIAEKLAQQAFLSACRTTQVDARGDERPAR